MYVHTRVRNTCTRLYKNMYTLHCYASANVLFNVFFQAPSTNVFANVFIISWKCQRLREPETAVPNKVFTSETPAPDFFGACGQPKPRVRAYFTKQILLLLLLLLLLLVRIMIIIMIMIIITMIITNLMIIIILMIIIMIIIMIVIVVIVVMVVIVMSMGITSMGPGAPGAPGGPPLS